MMRFKILKVNKSEKLLKLSKIKRSFLSKNEDLSLFHYFEVEKKLFHVVMHTNDEYLVGTKKNGNYMNVPFSQYINCFFLTTSEYFFVEDVGDAYINDITQYISKNTGAKFDSAILNNNQIESLVSFFSGSIKKVEYQDEDGEYVDYENISHSNFLFYNSQLDIDYINTLVDSHFVSIYKSGKISVDNNDENYIINFVKDVAHGLETNTY